MSDVFISYSRKDREFVRSIADKLKNEQRETWVDWEDIEYAEDWWQKICAGIESANNFIFVISPDSLSSDVCRHEIQHAEDHHKRIIPILHRELTQEEVQQLPAVIAHHNWLPFTAESDFTTSLAELLETIDRDPVYVKAHTRILVRAIEWDTSQRKGSLLLRGDDLNDAETWLISALDKNPSPTELQAQYIETSRQYERQRQRRVFSGIVTALVITGLLAILSFILFRQAESNLSLAEERGTGVANQAETADFERNNAVVAEATAVRNALAERSQAQVANAQSALNAGDTQLALALALEANSIPNPSSEAQLILAESAYHPGVVTFFEDHEETISGIVFSPDGDIVVTSSWDGTVLIRDFKNGTILHKLTQHAGKVNDIAISPDGRFVASVSDDQTAIIWDVMTGEMLHQLQGHNADVLAIAIHPNGETVLTGSLDGYLMVWDINSGELVQEMKYVLYEDFADSLELSIRDLAYSPDGQYIAVLNSFTISILDALTLSNEFNFDFEAQITFGTNLHFSPDGQYIAVGGQNGTIALLDLESQSRTRTLVGHSSDVNQVVFSPDGKQLASTAIRDVTGPDLNIKIWDVATGTEIYRFLEDYQKLGFTRLMYSPNGQYLAVGSLNGNVIVWELLNGALVQALEDDQISAIYGIDYSHNGKFILANGVAVGDVSEIIDNTWEGADIPTDSQLLMWDTETSVLVHRWIYEDTVIQDTKTSPNDQYALVSAVGGNVLVIDLTTGAVLYEIETDSEFIFDMTWSSDDLFFAAAITDNVLVWRLDDGALVHALPHDGASSEVIFSPDNHTILTTSGFHIYLWDAVSGERVNEAEAEDLITEAIYHPNGQQILIGLGESTLQVWDTTTWTQVGPIMAAHSNSITNGINTLDFSLDGFFAVSGGHDGNVVVWDMVTQKAIRRFTGHTNAIQNVKFSPDGQTIIANDFDGKVLMWRVDSADALLNWIFDNRLVAELTCTERLQYRVDPTCAEVAVVPTRTAYPTLTVTNTPTPTPTINETLTSLTPTNTTTYTPPPTMTATATATATFTATATPRAENEIPFAELNERVEALNLPFAPLLPNVQPEGFQMYRVRRFDDEETWNERAGDVELNLVFAVTEGEYDPATAEKILVITESPTEHENIQSLFSEQYGDGAEFIIELALQTGGFDFINGVEVILETSNETADLYVAVYDGLVIRFISRNVEYTVMKDFIASVLPPAPPLTTLDIETQVGDYELDFAPLLPRVHQPYTITGLQIVNPELTYGESAPLVGYGDQALRVSLTVDDNEMLLHQSPSAYSNLSAWQASVGLTATEIYEVGNQEVALLRFDDGSLDLVTIQDGLFISLISFVPQDDNLILGVLQNILAPEIRPVLSLTPEPLADAALPIGTIITIPGLRPMMAAQSPADTGVSAVCLNGTEATVLQTVMVNEINWVEIQCETGSGWVLETELTGE